MKLWQLSKQDNYSESRVKSHNKLNIYEHIWSFQAANSFKATCKLFNIRQKIEQFELLCAVSLQLPNREAHTEK